MQVQRRLGQHEPKGGTAPLPQAHAKIEQRGHPHPLQRRRVRTLGRDMGEDAVVDSLGMNGVSYGGSCGRNEAVDKHRDLLVSRGDQCAQHRGDLASPQAGEYGERIGETFTMESQSTIDGRCLALQPRIVDARAAADPVGAAAAIKRGIDRRRNGGIADAHFADGKAVGTAGDGLHAVRDGRRAHPVVHGRRKGDIPGGQVQREFEHPKIQLMQSADLADGRPAGGKVGDHLRSDLTRKSGNALVGYTVISGKNRHHRIVEGRLRLALPSGQPLNQFLHAAERARGLCQLAIADAHGIDSFLVAVRHQQEKIEHFGKRIGRHWLASTGGEWEKSATCREALGKCKLATEGAPAPRPTNDNRPAPAGFRFAEDLLMSIRFFSRLPTGNAPHERPDLNRMAPVLPLAGLIILLPSVAVFLLLQWLGAPSYFAAAFAVMTIVIINGGMAEDALADAADGLFGGCTAERRLEIMKDSRHGTYGVCAIVLLLLLRVTAIGSVPNALEAAGILLTAPILARNGASCLTLFLPPARTIGVSSDSGTVSRRSFLIGMAAAIVVSFATAGFAVGILGLLAAYALAALVAWGWITICRKLIGGQTGDMIGGMQSLLEIAVLTAFMVFV